MPGLAERTSRHELGRPRVRKSAYANEIRVASTIAETLADRRLMCELLGAMAGVLERNISIEFARDFKVRSVEIITAMSELVARHLPWLPEEFIGFIGEGALTLTAGMYPFSVPTDPVRQAMDGVGLSPTRATASSTGCAPAWRPG